jgi:pseudouridine-5'-phosphate glycosidase
MSDGVQGQIEDLEKEGMPVISLQTSMMSDGVQGQIEDLEKEGMPVISLQTSNFQIQKNRIQRF